MWTLRVKTPAARQRSSFTRRAALWAAGLAVAGGLSAPGAWAQTPEAYPSRPITLILPFPPGGATDVQIRALAQAASRELGQPILISNRPGVGGTLGPAGMAQTAAPDGYTVSLIAATLFRLPHLMKVSFDPVADFSYLICLTGYTNGLVVRQDAPWKTVQDLLADARRQPGAINYGSTGKGSGGHIAMERLARAAGVQFNFIPYKGMAEETAALLGGHLMVISDPGWGALAESGKARVLATLGESRLKRWPQVPTLRELGHDIVVNSPIGLAGPKGMSPKVVQVLHDAFRKAMNDPGFVRALEQNDQVPLYMSAEDYTRYAAEQTAREKVFVQELGLKLD
ncbi:tripartite tricarboxylate transporter substrate binding protein [Curvibacter sp. RS43]|uniref:tripartite tricarboxylate transporter substrate binding protein n=1 Tax=Curvibacter microcysteis TaxID=3026419 RepID=UPI002361E3CE|nr:tripartite tricarboxylate transporter substrate binding protein [Curvibacter sp. RS43]MDD0808931.1 tripartite tricarboxylate transporter substrate binding protein [Curvibacter sp. RS43]